MTTSKTDLDKNVRAAIVSGYWLVLGLICFIGLFYCIYLWIISNKPDCILTLLGPGVDWPQFQSICLWVLVIMKLFMWAVIALISWLNLFSRQLKKHA